MGFINDSVDLVKSSREWKKEYELKHDTDLYIHRITDLNNKLCEENEKLKKEIELLKNKKFKLTYEQHQLCENILIDEDLTYNQALSIFYRYKDETGEDEEDEDHYDHYRGVLEVEQLIVEGYLKQDCSENLKLTSKGKNEIIKLINELGSTYTHTWKKSRIE